MAAQEGPGDRVSPAPEENPAAQDEPGGEEEDEDGDSSGVDLERRRGQGSEEEVLGGGTVGAAVDLRAMGGNAKIDADAVLDAVDPFGAFQKTWYLLLCLPAGMTACLTMSFAFTAAVPAHRCLVPGCDAAASAADADYAAAFDGASGFAPFAIPADGASPSGYSECLEFRRNPGAPRGECDAADFDNSSRANCSSLVFDRSVYRSTIATDFGLACAEEWKVPLLESAFFFSILVNIYC